MVQNYNIRIFHNFHLSGIIGEKACKGIELQDIHEAYQILLKIVKARVMFSDKLADIRTKDSPETKEEKEKEKEKNVNKAALFFKKKIN